MTDRLAGKVALITGGASGLGANAAALMAQEGARVVVADIAADRGKAVADKLGSAGHFVKLDVTSEDNWQAAIAADRRQVRRHPRAAELRRHRAQQDGRGHHARGMAQGARHRSRRRVPGLQARRRPRSRSTPQKLGGSVINISSISGIIAGANMAAYNSAKAGVRLLSKSVALHCAKSGYNIRCNSVHPTFIDTPILDKYRDRFGQDVMQQKLGRQVPIGRLGRPEEVGWALVFLASDESSFMTGSEVVIDGGISAM